MAEECLDNDYIQAYSRFFAKFAEVEKQPEEDLTVQMRRHEIYENEILGEIINVAVQYLDSMNCPPSLQAYLVRQVVQDMQTMCKERPKECGFEIDDKTYSPLRLSRAITNKVNEVCWGYMDNSKLGSLPPYSSYAFPQVIAGYIKNLRRKMEDRHTILHDLNSMLNVKADNPAHYYAVFDGHGGRGAAVYCAAHLHVFLVKSVYYPIDPRRALHDAFLKTDAQYIEKFNKNLQKSSSGSTVTCALIIDKKLYVAWVGDSSSILVSNTVVKQLVNPHRLDRRDEVERIIKNGALPLHNRGTLRVNGLLENSRSIGDAEYKPYVTGEPEIKCVSLNGTEDFIVIATDGLWDFVSHEDVTRLIYQEIYYRPNTIQDVHHVLFEKAKSNGSHDNITIIIIFLTPVTKILDRLKKKSLTEKTEPNDQLNNMDSNNPFLPNANGLHESTTNGSFIKEAAQLLVENGEGEDEQMEENHIIYDTTSKGKHEIGNAEYDYTEDLGPETNVDTIDDMPPTSLNYLDDQYRYFVTNHSAKTNYDDETMKDELYAHSDEKSIDSDHSANCESVTNANFNTSEPMEEEGHDSGEKERTRDVVDDDAGEVDYDDCPPSPQAMKPLQHALIPEADNVADTEDSEDEWNYYPVDPNQQKESVALVDEQQTPKDESEEVSPETAIEDTNTLETQSPEVERDIKCESPTEKVSPEHIDTKSNAEEEKEEEEEGQKVEKTEEKKTFVDLEQESEEAMDFQLNPDAKEFIPVSPQILGARLNLGDDYPISGSPLKQVPQMDDIQVPSQTEFDEELCRRPRDLEGEEKECVNGDHVQYTNYSDLMTPTRKILGAQGNLDDSEISSTRAEFGDESAASFLTASEFHRTGVSTIDESFGASEIGYDISKDPMAISLTPNEFEAAFEKGVDLNAVHDLTDADLDIKNGVMEDENLLDTSEKLSEADLISPETEEAPCDLNDAEQNDVVHTSVSQMEEAEFTFVEHASVEESKPVEQLELQHEYLSSEGEQHDDIKADHSPLADNYSAEFESEKEPISVDNEQPLSPSSVDIDKTKPIDETSEDAALPTTDSQKEDYQKGEDTPSSLSPVPDAMECTTPQKEEYDVLNLMQNAQISSTPNAASALHFDAPEFKPSHFTFDPDHSESTAPTADLAEEKENVQEEEQLIDIQEEVKEPVPEESFVPQVAAEEKPQSLDVFGEREVCMDSETKHFEMTPPLSPREPENKIVEDIQESCPLLVNPEDEDKNVPTAEEALIETEPCEEVQAHKEPSFPAQYQVEMSQVSAGMNLSESMQEFTGLEKQLEPEHFAPEESKPVDVVEPQLPKEEEVKPVEEPKEPEPEIPVEEIKEPEIVAPIVAESKEPEVETVEAVSQKQITEVSATNTAVVTAAAATAVAATVAAAATAAGAAAKAKTKPAAKPTKTTATKPTSRTTPLSPSKSMTATSRLSTTGVTKKPVTSTTRPKETDATKKPTTATTNKAAVPKSATSVKSTIPATTTKPTTARTNLGKPRSATASSAKPGSATGEKKPTLNGDVKPSSKPIPSRTISKPSTTTSTAATKSSLAKSATTTRTTTTSVTAPKPRSASATTQAKTTTAKPTTSSTTTASSTTTRPKTAPVTSSTVKSRVSSTVKSPMIDKQIKETANKQISLARTSTSTGSKTTRTLSATSSTTTTVKRTSTSKTVTSTSSPTKKVTSTTKVSGKVSNGTKTITGTSKTKVVQNGVSESTEKTSASIINADNKIEDDIPKKDLSPVVVPTDNQLIMSTD